MPEIGATLREARMRQRIDISDVEARTKIRAKYLRALENEEWDLLPGPTFVKTFLRTYAETLGLDARLLLEEYKLRYERLTDHELQPIGPPRAPERRERRTSPLARDALVALLVVGLVGLLILLGRDSGGGGATDTQSARPPTAARGAASAHRRAPRRTPAGARLVRLRLVPTGPVWVCLRAAGNRTLIGGQVIRPGQRLPAFRSRRFTMTLGNGALHLVVDGRTLQVPEVSQAIGYSVSRQGRRPLPAGSRPTCS